MQVSYSPVLITTTIESRKLSIDRVTNGFYMMVRLKAQLHCFHFKWPFLHVDVKAALTLAIQYHLD